MSDDQPTNYSLVMPFVVCHSTGGPYEDQAFVAGYQTGQIDAALKAGEKDNRDHGLIAVYTELLPQLDLVAMRYGYTMTSEPTQTEAWSYVSFRRTR